MRIEILNRILLYNIRNALKADERQNGLLKIQLMLMELNYIRGNKIMKKFTEYPSISQFRDTIRDLNHAQFIGLDSNNEPIYDRTFTRPTIKFTGTVKLHGTNAAVCWSGKELFAQSRTQIITPENDNAGFAAFVEEKTVNFAGLFFWIGHDFRVPDEKTIVVYGEWAGVGIQKGVAINNLPKSFFIFDICLVNEDEEGNLNREWLDISGYRDPDNRIYNIKDYQTFEIEIDFNNPALVQNDLIALTEEVERECPVGKAFGFSGIGEGLVWSAIYNGKRHVFKVKGEKHSVTKVKTLANVDVEKLNSINEFVDYAVTENRVNQAIENVCKDNMSMTQMGDVIRWTMNDIRKEESDTMEKNGLSEKDVNKSISTKVRQIFDRKLNEKLLIGVK